MKLQAFANDKKKNGALFTGSVFDRVENIVGKGENVGSQHFLLFQQCFQTPFFSGSFKVGTVWHRVKQEQVSLVTAGYCMFLNVCFDIYKLSNFDYLTLKVSGP